MITQEEIEQSVRGKKAKENFQSGYNCTQSVLLAYEDYQVRRKAPCFSYGDIRRVHRIGVSN